MSQGNAKIGLLNSPEATPIGIPILAVLTFFIGSIVMHVCLLAVGALRNSTTKLAGTMRVIGYAQVGELALLIPLIGFHISLIWKTYLLLKGFAIVHKTSTVRAFLAILIPVALAALVFVFMIGAMLAFLGAILRS